jgi:short-subunit dehydrogenase
VEDISIEEARRQFDVNIFGVARLTKEVIPHMRAAGKGTIINISSVGGKIYSPFGSWYHATKHALEGWSDCLRLELEPFEIQVAIVEPGAIRTELYDVMYQTMLDRSERTPYESYVNNFYHSTEDFETNGSPPSVVSNVIVKACESKTPKRRYLIGSNAKPMVFLRGWFGDGVFDVIMRRFIRNESK